MLHTCILFVSRTSTRPAANTIAAIANVLYTDRMKRHRITWNRKLPASDESFPDMSSVAQCLLEWLTLLIGARVSPLSLFDQLTFFVRRFGLNPGPHTKLKSVNTTNSRRDERTCRGPGMCKGFPVHASPKEVIVAPLLHAVALSTGLLSLSDTHLRQLRQL